MAKRPKLAGIAAPRGSATRSATRPRGWAIFKTEPGGCAYPRETTVLPMPNATRRIRGHDPGCFPSASPTPALGPGKQKAAPKDRLKLLISLTKSGAGEGIRTLDPDLGKVVLYP